MRTKRGAFATPRCPVSTTVFTLARYLMRNETDAEDAVQECYLRALRHFDSYHGPAIKPWLLAILRNVCKAEFARRSAMPAPPEGRDDDRVEDPPAIWQGPQPSPEVELLQRSDGQRISRLVAELPQPFREAVVLRDINNLSYREIAEVARIPLGTVISRLARARSMLRAAWNGEEGSTT
jgi:RNA polymerase sigma-70 factor, ECF subfamily